MRVPPTRSRRVKWPGCSGGRRRQDPGVLPQFDPLRLDLSRDPYGSQISRMTGGKHFVVNTGDNGRGPLRPRDIVQQGNEVLCNPAGSRPRPQTEHATGYPKRRHVRVDEQPGRVRRRVCAGRVPGGPTGAYWPAYGLMLVSNATSKVRPGDPPEARDQALVIVPWPMTRSPSIRHASWPGAAASAEPQLELERRWRPAGGPPSSLAPAASRGSEA